MSDALLAELDADPSNVEVWQIYADWLTADAHPRGELILIDLALRSAPESELQRLRSRRGQLIAERGPKLLGKTASQAQKAGFLTVEWGLGFVRRVAYTGQPGWRHKRQVSWLVELLSDPSFRFLEDLDLSYSDLAVLGGLPTRHLTRLVLRSTNLATLDGIEAFGGLTMLDIGDTMVRDLESLNALSALRKLVVSDPDELSDLEALKTQKTELTVEVVTRRWW